MPPTMVKNILGWGDARYLKDQTYVENWLKDEFGRGYNFEVEEMGDRIHFKTPEKELNQEQRERLIDGAPESGGPPRKRSGSMRTNSTRASTNKGSGEGGS